MSGPGAEKTLIPDPGERPDRFVPNAQSKFNQNPNISDDLVIVDWHDWREGISHKETWLLQVHSVPWSGLIFLTLAILFFGSGPLSTAFAVSREVMFAVLALPLIWLLVIWVRRSRVWKLSPSEKLLHGEAGRRVRLIASEAMLTRVGMPSVDPFEPRLFRVYGAVRGEMWLRQSIAAGCALLTLGVFLFVRGAGRLSWTALGAGGMPMFFDFQVAMFMWFLPTFFLWPTYYRVVPGRLDIMKFPMISTGKAEVERVNLREPRVSADASSGAIRLERADGRRSYIQFLGTPTSRMEFAKAVAEAATSPHEAPALPDDELVG